MSARFLEKNILNKVDELIEILISLSNKDADYEKKFQICLDKTEEIIPLVLQLIDGNRNLVVPMLHQLIMEKLPDARIISSFGGLQEEVNNLLNKTKEKYEIRERKKPPQSDMDYEMSSDISPQKGLHKEVQKAYPGLDIFANYRMGGVFVDIYIPTLKLALITDSKKNNSVLKFYCQENNIQLIEIPTEYTDDYRRISRFIRQKQIK